MTNKRVLLVEGEPRLLQSENKLLEDQFNIFPAINGQNAFDLFMQVHIDCAIVDVNLVDMNGYELVGKIRAKRKKTPIIMVSERGCEGDKKQGICQPLAISHCFQKPYDINTLISMIKTLTA